jgi:predicted nucleic acid-binding protein
MKVLVDTCIWSNAFRRENPDSFILKRLTDLIYDGRVAIIGPIRQEIFSGISNKKQFSKLKNQLSAFIDIPLTTEHYIKAAEFNSLCRKNSIQGSAVDFLICSVAHINRLAVFTDDKDFNSYLKYLPINLLGQN